MNQNNIMIKRDGKYYNKSGQRIHNPEAYMKAVMENKYGYNK